MRDCFTCEYAKRDNHNRFMDMCSGHSNCSYSEFKGKIKATLEEYINLLNKNNKLNKETNIVKEEYFEGFKQALEYIQKWNETE